VLEDIEDAASLEKLNLLLIGIVSLLLSIGQLKNLEEIET
jgi:hypothetical protein